MDEKVICSQAGTCRDKICQHKVAHKLISDIGFYASSVCARMHCREMDGMLVECLPVKVIGIQVMSGKELLRQVDEAAAGKAKEKL